MIPVPNGAGVWLASGHTDMRRGFDSLALQVQETLSSSAILTVVICSCFVGAEAG